MNCLVLCVVVILLLDVNVLLSVGGSALLYGLPMSVMPVITVCIQMHLPYVRLCLCMSELSPHLRVRELEHRCLLSSYWFFV